MTRAALTILLLLGGFGGFGGCTAPASVNEVRVHGIDVEFRGFHPARERTLTLRFKRELARSVLLDGKPGKEVTRVTFWNQPLLGSPPLDPAFAFWFHVVGYCQVRGEKAKIHLAGDDPIRVLRHELHHTRAGGGHQGPKWEEIEKERFAKEWVGE